MLGDDLDAADQLIDNWESAIKERAAQAKALSDRAAGLTATARSTDGAIEVTVDTSGGITKLVLSERIRSRPAHETSDQILAVMRSAQARLAQLMTQAAEEVGAGDVGRTIAASYASRFPMPTDPER
jgi:ABC-type transporter Mla subunit MlaD